MRIPDNFDSQAIQGKRDRSENKITKITIHHAAVVDASLQGLGNGFSGSRVASSNYGIDSDGNVGMYVEEQYRAITSSSTGNDNVAVTIEVAYCKGAPNWEVSDRAGPRRHMLWKSYKI